MLPVYVPYVWIQPETRAALEEHAAGHEVTFVYVGGSDSAMWEMYDRLWREERQRGFVVVEHDIVIHGDVLPQFERCSERWCTFAYPYAFGNANPYHGTGCVRWSANLIATVPLLWKNVAQRSAENHPQKHWCPDEAHRILTADLNWVPAGDLRVGDALVGFDGSSENGQRRRYRRYRQSVIEAIAPASVDVVRVVVEGVDDLYLTADHRLLASSSRVGGGRQRGGVSGPAYHWRWADAGDLSAGVWLAQYVEPWSKLKSWEAGYLAGLFDGEGTCLVSGCQLSFAQVPGPVLELGQRCLRQLGYRVGVRENANGRQGWGRGVKRVSVLGSTADRLRFFGSIRPERLLQKLEIDKLGVLEVWQRRKVLAVEPVGKRTVSQIQTSSGTYLTEGFASHNCSLDGFSQLVLRGYVQYPHQHEPPVGHVDPGNSHGCLGQL
jgi:hypothetical protein